MSKLSVLTIACLLAACSSTPTREDVAKDIARADVVRTKALEARDLARQKIAAANIADIPSWVLEVPKPDDRGVYAVGSAKSDDVQLVTKKAMLNGQFGLAKQIQQEISGGESSVRSESDARRGTEVYRSTIATLVSRVPVVGVEVLRNDVKVLPTGQYAGYVLLLLPYEQINRVLAQQRVEAAEGATRSALDDLDRRVRQRQDARIRDAEATQRLRMADLGQGTAIVKSTDQPTPAAPAASAADTPLGTTPAR